jgi:hypothetical protein
MKEQTRDAVCPMQISDCRSHIADLRLQISDCRSQIADLRLTSHVHLRTLAPPEVAANATCAGKTQGILLPGAARQFQMFPAPGFNEPVTS